MESMLITGGAGFVGSHVFEHLFHAFPKAHFHIIDKMTYAANIENIMHLLSPGKRTIEVGDICDFDLCVRATRNCDCVINLAAESHVDNSFGNSLAFTHSNTLGTHTLLEACRLNRVPKIIHVSTDEVYGEIRDGVHVETDILNPTNPYSASKAAADMIVNGYLRSFNLPVVVVRANNIYGTRQYPEKIIPRFIMQALTGNRFTLHGNGQNRRRFLSALDFARAIKMLIERGQAGEVYNIGSPVELTNRQVRDLIAGHLGLDPEANTEYVQDRPFNDFRYAINCDKLESMGWKPQRNVMDDMAEMVAWYRDNRHRYDGLFVKGKDLVSDRL